MAGNKSSIEAGRGHVTLGTDQGPLDKGLDAAEKRFKAWGKGIMALAAGIGASAATITAPFLYGLSVFSDWGKEVALASRETGISFRELEGLAGGLRVGLDELVPGIGKMSAFLNEAAHGSAEANRAMQEMGITLEEVRNMTQAERLYRFADGIASIGDAAQRVAMQRTIFGRGGLALNLEGGSEGLRRRAEREREVFGERTPQDLALAKEYNLAMREMGLATKGLWASLGAAAAPAMTEFFTILTNVIIGVRHWVDANRELLGTIFRVADVTVTAMAIVAPFGAAVYALGKFQVFSTAATVAWTLAVWTYNAAVAVAHALTYGWILLLLPVAVVTNVVSAALIAAAGAAIYFGAKWLLASGYIETAWAKIKAVSIAVADAVMDHFAPVFAFIRDGFNAAVAYVMPMFTKIADAVSGAAMRTWDNLKGLFENLFGTAKQTWQGVIDALKIGDFELLWSIVKAAASLVWHDISTFAEEAFEDWYDAGVDVFNAISDMLTDIIGDGVAAVKATWAQFLLDLEGDFPRTIENIWLAVKGLFAEGFGFVINGWWKVAAAIVDSLGGPLETVRTLLRGLAFIPGNFPAQAALAALDRVGGNAQALRDRGAAAAQAGVQERSNLLADLRWGQTPDQIQAARDIERGMDQVNREIRDMDLEIARMQRQVAAAGEGTAERATLQARLDDLTQAAMIARMQREMDAIANARGDMLGGDTGLTFSSGAKSVGSFFADAFLGMGGAATNPVMVTNQRLEEIRNLNTRMVDLLANMDGAEFA